MSKYKIGITEAGDAGLDLSWANKLDTVDGAIVITKTPNNAFIREVLKHKDKLIVHATITGNGGSIIEPNVPNVETTYQAIEKLRHNGFPIEKITIRVDPIIPDKEHIKNAAYVIDKFASSGYRRFRVSIIDMYPHVRQRFVDAGIELPYGGNFSPSLTQCQAVDEMLRKTKTLFPEIQIESCAEPRLSEPIKCGCVSAYDLTLLGLNPEDSDTVGFQRKNCLCYSGKTELLTTKHRCANQCLYCYWR